MLVVIAIIGIITLVVITSQGSFNKSIILSNAAYDVALALRSAESYGLSSRLTDPANTHVGYGLEFSVGPTFTFFSDSDPASPSACHPTPPAGADAPDAKWGDCVYTADKDAYISTYTLQRGITITEVCTYSSANTSCVKANRLDVIYIRPDPHPYMSTNGTFNPGQPTTAACLALTSPQGGARYVAIAATGEINANATPCP